MICLLRLVWSIFCHKRSFPLIAIFTFMIESLASFGIWNVLRLEYFSLFNGLELKNFTFWQTECTILLVCRNLKKIIIFCEQNMFEMFGKWFRIELKELVKSLIIIYAYEINEPINSFFIQWCCCHWRTKLIEYKIQFTHFQPHEYDTAQNNYFAK